MLAAQSLVIPNIDNDFNSSLDHRFVATLQPEMVHERLFEHAEKDKSAKDVFLNDNTALTTISQNGDITQKTGAPIADCKYLTLYHPSRISVVA